jgi:two-component system, OmpR family, sensor kinase ParS
MLRLFLRLYLFLMLPATAAFVGFMYLTDQVMAQMHKEDMRKRAGVAFDRAERILTAKEVPNWEGRLKEIEATFRIEHRVVPKAEAADDWFMSGSEKERLVAGDIAFRDRPGGGQVYLRNLKDGSGVLRIEWVGLYEYLTLYYTIIVALVTLGLSLILLRWVRPLYRDLENLTDAAGRLGEGDLAARAAVGRSSLVEPIAGAFNAMTERIQRLLTSHRDLEQGVAHELRTPLAQLKFDLELARTSATAEEREARFASMSRDVADLEELVNELLLVANLRQAPPYSPKAIPARVLIDDVIRRAKDEMRARGREVAIEPPKNIPETLHCDGKFLARALVNVVRNAVLHARSRVVLTVEQAAGRTTVHVDDDGPGIAPADRERLFAPFTRAESSRDRETGGVGLGLAIVRSVAEWHGGSARIQDSPLGGARVSIAW